MPLYNYTPIVPNISSENINKSMMFNTDGNEFNKVITRPRMPCSEFKVRNGLKILMTRMAEIFRLAAESDTQPRITTEKSRMFHGSLRYECGSMKKPIAMIFKIISTLKISRKIMSNVSMIGSGSSKLGSSMAKQMQLAKMVSKMNLSNHELKTMRMTALLKRLVVVQPHRATFAKFLVWFC